MRFLTYEQVLSCARTGIRINILNMQNPTRHSPDPHNFYDTLPLPVPPAFDPAPAASALQCRLRQARHKGMTAACRRISRDLTALVVAARSADQGK